MLRLSILALFALAACKCAGAERRAQWENTRLTVGTGRIWAAKHVPDRHASHGCVRFPLTNDNPTKRFYEWVEIGTPVTISGRWEQ